jgi:hypothetical protein
MWPILLAGTCSKYSNSAMPQLISAAIQQAALPKPVTEVFKMGVPDEDHEVIADDEQ